MIEFDILLDLAWYAYELTDLLTEVFQLFLALATFGWMSGVTVLGLQEF